MRTKTRCERRRSSAVGVRVAAGRAEGCGIAGLRPAVGGLRVIVQDPKNPWPERPAPRRIPSRPEGGWEYGVELVALPDDDGGVAGAHGHIGERDAMLERQIVLQNNHATVWVDHARVRFSLDALAGGRLPLQPHGHARIHTMPAALLLVAGFRKLRVRPRFFLRLFGVNGHTCL